MEVTTVSQQDGIGPMFGMCIGLFYDEELVDYEGLVWEAAHRGVAAVAFVLVAYQEDTSSSELDIPDDRQLAELERISAYAKRLGLHVTVMPVVLLRTHSRGRWRGAIAPSDSAAWWERYGAWMNDLGALSARAQVDRVVVGSELTHLQSDTSRWRALIAELRTFFRGELTYSANWDSMQSVAFWDDLDVIGVSAYFSMPYGNDGSPRVRDLDDRWRAIQAELRDLSARWGRPVALSEVGYPARNGAAARPWRHVGKHRIDLVGQYELFDALIAAWEGQAWADAVFVWDFVRGGPDDSSYSLRGKPAGLLFRQRRGRTTPLIQPTER